MTKKDYKWHQQSLSDDCKLVDYAAYDPIKDFRRDPTGCYVLIRLDREECFLELALCSKDHTITHVFRGKRPQDIYNAIYVEQKAIGETFFGNLQHSAYLGKELQRAYQILQDGGEYIQE